MAIRYKVDIMAELKKKGYSSTKIREEKLIGQSYLQQIRHGELVSWKTISIQKTVLLALIGRRSFNPWDGRKRKKRF